MGDTLYDLARYTQALEVYDEVERLELCPEQAATLACNRAGVYSALGRYSEALELDRLALRLEGGAVLARDGADIPVTQLFLTGGDTTVRGYGYRSIGARTDADKLFGGRYMAVGSAEWQRPITVRGNRTDFESALVDD